MLESSSRQTFCNAWFLVYENFSGGEKEKTAQTQRINPELKKVTHITAKLICDASAWQNCCLEDDELYKLSDKVYWYNKNLQYVNV